MALASGSVMVEQASRNACHKCLFPLDELHLAPASQGGSPRSAGGSNQGSFWITALALRPRTYEVLCHPLRMEFISHSTLALLNVCSAGLQGQTLWGLFSQCRTSSLESHNWKSVEFRSPCSFGRTSTVVIILPFVGHPCGGIVPDYCVPVPPSCLVMVPLCL